MPLRRITGLFTLRRLKAARATKNRSRAKALCAVFLRHIWGRGHCYAMTYYLPQTSYTTGNVMCNLPRYSIYYSYHFQTIDKTILIGQYCNCYEETISSIAINTFLSKYRIALCRYVLACFICFY